MCIWPYLRICVGMSVCMHVRRYVSIQAYSLSCLAVQAVALLLLATTGQAWAPTSRSRLSGVAVSDLEAEGFELS